MVLTTQVKGACTCCGTACHNKVYSDVELSGKGKQLRETEFPPDK
jgi:hypothetical protein